MEHVDDVNKEYVVSVIHIAIRMHLSHQILLVKSFIAYKNGHTFNFEWPCIIKMRMTKTNVSMSQTMLAHCRQCLQILPIQTLMLVSFFNLLDP